MDISSKFSLYDILAMIIPGGVIMACILLFPYLLHSSFHIIECDDCVITKSGWDTIDYIIFFVASYILGLINNSICDYLFRGFRNNPSILASSLLKITNEQENKNLLTFTQGINISNNTPTNFFSLAWITTKAIVFRLVRRHSIHLELIQYEYFQIYHLLIQKDLLGAIPIIESQIALFRNLIFPLIILGILIILNDNPYWGISLVLTAIPVYLVMIYRQNKIYTLVWEGANYYTL